MTKFSYIAARMDGGTNFNTWLSTIAFNIYTVKIKFDEKTIIGVGNRIYAIQSREFIRKIQFYSNSESYASISVRIPLYVVFKWEFYYSILEGILVCLVF